MADRSSRGIPVLLHGYLNEVDQPVHGACIHGDQLPRARIEAGKVADMIILDANPLTDIRNTGRIAGLVFNGQYLDRVALDDLLAFAEEQAGSVRTNLQLLWGALRSPVVQAQFVD